MEKKLDKLDSKLNELKKDSEKKELDKLTKRLYNLDLPKKYLKILSQDKLQYVHVKLHNALAYKKPFAKIENIKKVHDLLIKYLKTHVKVDKLDN